MDKEHEKLPNFSSSTPRNKHCRLVYCKSPKTGNNSIYVSIITWDRHVKEL